ncbi:hypothetical protein HNP46_007026 [Pseudomonas nitritireducens]|uniref:Uncharacterized protein n=1 Tax=Pseudomonas nitroreducens TaxID=46680 RepID=A0A7W7KSG0_PSENT|nr:hypothetical protein [Pseudomonas nitritireducens]MBB4868107.1 hypothetical protein [Pseudomonas nitritireducens]
MELSRFELHLDLCLRHLVGGSEPVLLNPLIERLSLKAKMDALREVIARRHAGEADCLREFNAWYAVMDRIRAKRNAFIHGGWVFNYYEQEVVNLAPGLPGSITRKEIRYSLSALEQELVAAEMAARDFVELRRRWGF